MEKKASGIRHEMSLQDQRIAKNSILKEDCSTNGTAAVKALSSIFQLMTYNND
jgi:hypothetical protein